MAINFSRQTLFYLIDVCAQSSVKYQKSLYEMKMNFIPGRTPPHAVHLNILLTKIHLYAQCTYRFIHLKCRANWWLLFLLCCTMQCKKEFVKYFYWYFSKGKTQRVFILYLLWKNNRLFFLPYYLNYMYSTYMSVCILNM